MDVSKFSRMYYRRFFASSFTIWTSQTKGRNISLRLPVLFGPVFDYFYSFKSFLFIILNSVNAAVYYFGNGK